MSGRRKPTKAPAPGPVPWRPSSTKSGEYLKTLHEWGALPEVASVRNVAALLAALSGQDAAAISDVLREAILTEEVPFWGLGPAGAAGGTEADWVPNMLRVRQVAQALGKSEPDESGDVRYTLALENVLHEDGGPVLHLEAMAVRPADAVALLVKRGRPVPAALAELVPRAPVALVAVRQKSDPVGGHLPALAKGRGEPALRAQERAILEEIRAQGLDPQKLEKAPLGNKPWPLRDEMRAKLGFTKNVMLKAWKRLRADGSIADA